MQFKDEKKVFSAYLTKKGLKNTSQRNIIMEVFLSEEKHLTAEELFLLVKTRNPAIGYATVYRTMKLLFEAGIAAMVNLGENRVRFEHSYRHELHEHMVCSNCGAAIEFKFPEIKAIEKRIIDKYGFKPTGHSLRLFGICNNCERNSK